MRPELESIYLTAPIGLGVLDRELRFVRVNDRLAEMNGFPVEAHIGRRVADLLPDMDETALGMLERVLQSGEFLRDVEIRGQTPAQPGIERIWIEQISPLHDEQGRIKGLSIVAEEVTEQRRAHALLLHTKETLGLAMEAAGLAVWEWDIRANTLSFGDNWEQMLGYGFEEQRGWSRADWHELMHPDDRDKTVASIEAHVAGATLVYECEYRLRHSNGQWVWISSRGRIAEWDSTGKPVRMIGVGRDITAERAIQHQLTRQAQLLELSFDAIFTWRDDGGIQSWNRGAELQYGYSSGEALGVHPDVLLQTAFPGTRREVQDALNEQGVWRGELSHRTKDGRRITVAAVLQRVNEHERTLEITRDITQAKNKEMKVLASERELRHWQERLQVALDAGHMGAWDWSPGGDSFWSAEVYKLLGLEAESAAQDDFQFLQRIHPDDRPRFDAEIGRVLARGGAYEADFRIVRADGQVRWLLSRGRVMHDSADKPTRIVGVNFDITDRKIIEQGLQEADTRRTEFLAMLAHELRNPLAPIVNAVRLLEVAGEAAHSREAATQILRRQTTQLARLVDDLRDASRITQGRIELRVENVLLATCAFQAVEAARPQARERRQTLDVDVLPTLDLVADPARLTQIISNLLTNAVKYTQEEGTIDLIIKSEDPHWVTIVVQDNGPGISPELQPRIFELFTQDPAMLHRSEGGLGIGLALVKRLTELHGGHVRQEDRPDGAPGARFVVELPRYGRRSDLRGCTMAGAKERLAPMSMLVVDDNEDSADTLASLLRLDGHQVETANDGERALAAASEVRPEVVILDLGLPKLDGVTVAATLRKNTSLGRPILVAVSGYAQEADLEATAAAGFDGHLAKPVELSDLYGVIRAALT